MKKASELIDQVFNTIDEKYSEEKKYVSLFSGWERIVGSDIGAHSSIREIEGNTLLVEADHPSWAQIISLKNREILKKIGKAYPELQIGRIRIIIS